MKKQLNFLNYTKHDHDVITNQRLSSAYTTYRNGLHNYEWDKPDPKNMPKGRFLNRSPPGTNTNKKFIRRNISQIKNLSNFNKLRNLDDFEEYSPHRKTPGYTREVSSFLSRPNKRNNSSYILFKRKNKSQTRRFNEGNMSNLVKMSKLIA